MATERIEIIVTERGTREVDRRLNVIGQTAARSASGVDLLKRAIGFIGGVALVRGLIRTADTFTLIQNRLKVVTNSTQELNAVTNRLFDIAQNTRASFRATAEVYARATRAVESLGISQQETLNFTETLNQAVILSGASTQEAAGGLIQLSQALASSRLSGDEFRSVSEQLPVVLKILANELGVNIGQLRKLGQEGQLTADVVLRAFRNAREAIAEEFAKTIPTIGQSFVILQNAVIRFVGKMNEASLVGKVLSLSIIGVANSFDTLGRVVIVASTVLGVGFANIAIGKVIAGLRALKIALASTGIGAVVVILGTIITSLVVFSDKIRIASDTTTTLADVGVATFLTLRDAFTALLEQLGPALAITKTFLRAFVSDFDFSFRGILKLVAYVLDQITGFIQGTLAAAGALFENFGNIVELGLVKGVQGAFNLLIDTINAFIDSYNSIGLLPPINPLERITLDVSPGAKNAGRAVADAFDQGFAENSNFAQNLLNNEILPLADQLAARRAADNNPNLSTGPGGPAPSFGNNFDAAIAARQSAATDPLQNALTAYDDIVGPQQQFIDQQKAVNDLFEAGKISATQYQIAMANIKAESLEFGTTVADGFSRGFQRIKADILDVSTAAEQTLTNAFKSAEDGLVEFVQTGTFNFSKLVDGILADLTRLVARQAIAGLLGSLGGAGGGGGTGGLISGIIGGLGGARANGGPVNPNESFLVGERGPELFTPSTRGNIVPNDTLRAGVAAPPQVNVNVVNVTNPDEVAAAIGDGQADSAIINFMQRNKDAVKRNLELAS